MTVLCIVLAAVVVVCLAVKLYLSVAGLENVVLKERQPLVKEAQTEDSITLSTKLVFANEGKQCATFMDAIVRPQLPYEQYDGVEARAKAERDGYPREDDYFEAVIVQRKGDADDTLSVYAKVQLTARKGMTIKEALSHMVDLPLDFIWMETGRMPWHYRKLRIELTAEEIAALAGVELVKD